MNRETFVTLNRTHLFTADQVVDFVQSERERLLDELVKRSHVTTNTDYFEGKRVVLVSDIRELRGE